MAPSPWMRPYMHTRGDTQQPTHLLMDGGMLVVHAHEIAEFRTKLAKSIVEGQVNFLCEKRSAERLKLCVDIDMYSKEAYTSEQLQHVIRIAAGVAFDLFSDSDKCLDVLVSASKPFDTEKNGEKCVKTGAHLVWENLTVDVRTAGIFRDALVQRLELSTLDAPMGGWSLAIDSAVAKHGILRLLYAHKLADCAHCHNKKSTRDSCQACLGKGRIDIGRPYEIKAVFIKAENRLEPVPRASGVEAIADHLARASIHTEDAIVAINNVRPSWFENPLMASFIADNKGRATKRSRRALAGALAEGHETLDSILDRELIRCDLAKKIQAYIRSVAKKALISDAYKDIEVTQAMYANERSIIFAKTDCTYCLNTRNEHRSNTIYFEIKRCGEMRQKCFCRCDTTVGRRHGQCSTFKSHPVNVPNKLLDELFPQTTHVPAVDDGGGTSDAAPPATGTSQKATVPKATLFEMMCNRARKNYTI